MRNTSTHKPQSPAPTVGGIPVDLRALENWVLWRYVWKVAKNGQGRWTKMPKQANGKNAKSNDPRTWASFETVMAAYSQGGGDGIGFCFPLEGGLVGGDCDHVVSPEGRVAPWVERLREKLPTYWEHSVSGTGFHFIVRGDADLPAHKWDMGEGSLELYGKGSARFFTFTGNRLAESPAAPTDCSENMAALVTQLQDRDASKPAPVPSLSTRARGSAKDLYQRAVAAMLKVPVPARENDGSRRLLSYCRQAVRWNLDDDEAVEAVREAESVAGAFPVEYRDSDILRRLRDAEKRVARGEALNNRGQWRSPLPPWIKKEVRLRTHKLALLQAIADRCDVLPLDACGSRGFCIASADALAEATGMTSRTVKRNVKAMRSAGIIVMVSKGGYTNDGEVAVNVYAIPGVYGALDHLRCTRATPSRFDRAALLGTGCQKVTVPSIGLTEDVTLSPCPELAGAA